MTNMTCMSAERRECVQTCVADIRAIELSAGVNRASLVDIAVRLTRLATREDLFDEATFPNPSHGERAKLHLLSEDAEGRFPLYLTCCLPGGTVAPHNHTTWAVVVGLAGTEENTIWTRTDGVVPPQPGPATLVFARRQTIECGQSMALMPEDIHSVATPGTVPRRHFHMYGLSLQRLPTRLVYNRTTGQCDFMPPNDKIVR